MSRPKRQKVFDHLEALTQALRVATDAGELDRYDLENVAGRSYAIYQDCRMELHQFGVRRYQQG